MNDRREELQADVAIGSDDFLFNRYEKAFQQICDASLPDDHLLARWVSLFETRFAWCAAKGIRYVTLIVPARHVIYEDKLPNKARVSPIRAARRLLNAMDPAFRAAVLYPDSALRATRNENDVFLKTDEHMNDYGSYLCYREILKTVAAEPATNPVDISDMIVGRRTLVGNLGMRLAEEPSEQVQTLSAPGNVKPVVGLRNKGGQKGLDIFINENRDLPRAIVFGDSNLHNILPFLKAHFSRIISLPANQRFYFDLARSEAPEVIINFMSELTLGHEAIGLAGPPVDNDGADFLDYCEEIAPERPSPALLTIDFATGGNSSIFVESGWGHAEALHTWMTSAESILRLPPLPVEEAIAQILSRRPFVTIEIELLPHIVPQIRPFQELQISIKADERWVQIGDYAISGHQTLWLSIPAKYISTEHWQIFRFTHPGGLAPAAVGGGADGRVLSLALRKLTVTLDSRAVSGGISRRIDALLGFTPVLKTVVQPIETEIRKKRAKRREEPKSRRKPPAESPKQ